MPQIVKNNDEPLRKDGGMLINAMEIPSFRINLAKESKVEKNILFKAAGGIGDLICAEPSIRYALENFPGCNFKIQTAFPEIYSHLNCEIVKDEPNLDGYLVIETLQYQESLSQEFISHPFTHCVDYHSLNMFRMQLPVSYKTPIVKGVAHGTEITTADILVHPGRSWQSKTFPRWWWNAVIQEIKARGGRPVLIGATPYKDRGTVDVDASGCVDLRDKLSIHQTIGLLHDSNVLITNDSAPLHMGATGNIHIGFISTVRHPDYLKHWRNGIFGWRMENLSLDGLWSIINMCPTNPIPISLDKVDENLMQTWLPEPSSVADWGMQCLTRSQA